MNSRNHSLPSDATGFDTSATPGTEQDIRQRKMLLFGLLLLGLLLRLFIPGGVTASDDLHLASSALRWLEEGFYLPETHVSLRVGLSLPLALVFKLFGVGEWQITLLPMIAGVGLIYLSYRIAAELFGIRAGLWAAAAVACFPLETLFSGRFYPDISFGAVSAFSVFLLLISVPDRSKEHGPGGTSWLLAVAAGLVWGYAYLIKIEAFFVGFAFLGLFLERRFRSAVVVAAIACLLVVLAENLVYFLASGEWLYRLQTILVSNVSSIRPEARVGELWTFPKAWFLTPYSFGLHYYFMFLGLILLAWRRPAGAWVVLLWLLSMLIWLEFGDNPANDSDSTKTKLLRYCSYVTAPMAAAVGYAMSREIRSWHPRAELLAGAVLISAGLFFSVFGMLSTEREVASKIAIRNAMAQNQFPLYLDSSSFAIAKFLTYGTYQADQVFRISDLGRAADTPATNQDAVTGQDAVAGYVLINRAFNAFRVWRYGKKTIHPDRFAACGSIVFDVDNPLPEVAYLQLEFLRRISAPLPVIGQKIQDTADNIAASDDAVVFALERQSIACLGLGANRSLAPD